LVIAWRFATWPTNRSPLFVKATTDGVVRCPSWFAITVGWPASITATTELVVPKSIPMILPIPLLILPSLNQSRILKKFEQWRFAANEDGVLVQTYYQTLARYCQVFLEWYPLRYLA
jgi:hypothetical protein